MQFTFHCEAQKDNVTGIKRTLLCLAKKKRVIKRMILILVIFLGELII